MDSKSFIYKIYNEASDLFYIGSTSKCIYKRFGEHFRDAKNKNISSYKLFELYNNNRIIVLEEFVNISRTELYKKEGEILSTFINDKNCLNKSSTRKTVDKNELSILSERQIYYQTHKNSIRNIQKKYRNNNKEKLKDYALEWKANLSEDKKNQIIKKTKERVSKKMKCLTCDCFFKKGSLLRHKKTQKHLKILEENEREEEFIEMSETVIIESVEYQN
jgi:hypothetical protein